MKSKLLQIKTFGFCESEENEYLGVENILKDYVDLINKGFRLIRKWN